MSQTVSSDKAKKADDIKLEVSSDRLVQVVISLLSSFEKPALTRGVWTSPTPHYFGNASCHPHCHPGQGDEVVWREQVPAGLTSPRMLILDGGDNANQLEIYTIAIDDTNLATVTYIHRTHGS